MSCTRSKDVSLAYAANQQQKGPGMVLEVQMGMVDRGADLTWVSQARYSPRCRPRDAATLRPRGTSPSISHVAQYPHELEILFPPLTSIEVRSLRVEKKARPGLEHGRPALHTYFRMPSTFHRCW